MTNIGLLRPSPEGVESMKHNLHYWSYLQNQKPKNGKTAFRKRGNSCIDLLHQRVKTERTQRVPQRSGHSWPHYLRADSPSFFILRGHALHAEISGIIVSRTLLLQNCCWQWLLSKMQGLATKARWLRWDSWRLLMNSSTLTAVVILGGLEKTFLFFFHTQAVKQTIIPAIWSAIWSTIQHTLTWTVTVKS